MNDHSREGDTVGVASIGVSSIVAIGIVSLAVAMGIGRFAFTPLLPLMLRDGAIDAGTGADWATANYLGYFVGALTAARLGNRVLQGLRIALVGVVVSTALAAFVGAGFIGALLRFAAGVFSAWVLVLASTWCLAALAKTGADRLGGMMYTGVGLGIAVAGIVCWLGGFQRASLLWIELGVLAAAGTAYAMIVLPRKSDIAEVARATAPSEPARGNLKLVICYFAFGFGYIVPATFLPALARSQVDDPLVFGLTWPLFGIASAISVALVTRSLPNASRRRVWAVAQAIMAVGTALPVLAQGLWSLTLAAILVGGTFMITTMAGLQLARELMPRNPTPLLARMTAAFAAGQIAGPLLVRLLGLRTVSGSDPMMAASAIAAVCLAITAVWLWYDNRESH
jgi:MFS family permease